MADSAQHCVSPQITPRTTVVLDRYAAVIVEKRFRQVHAVMPRR